MLEGERVVTGMVYTILKLHKQKLLKMKDMDLMTDFLQTKLHKDFGYNDDYVIRALEESMNKLLGCKMDLPPKPQDNELPKEPFGRYVEPNYEKKTGIRNPKFTEEERKTMENVILK